jgi:hypothetical protein
MFVQVIQGKTSDPTGLRGLADRWVDELGSDAQGWLGTTMGVTADGDFVGVVRFTSAEDAARNSDRPQQGAWWEEFSKHLDGEATFHDCTTADTWLAGGSDDAGFVQVIQSRIKDRQAVTSGLEGMASANAEEFGRADLIGGVYALHDDDDGLTQVAYFTSETAARQGESQEASPESQAAMEEFMAAVSDTRYFDLTDPWLASP